MNCKSCSGEMVNTIDAVGDGHTTVLHCEYADEPEVDYLESDASPVYCTLEELVRNKR